MTNLEKLTSELEYRFNELETEEGEQDFLRGILNQISDKDIYTAEHTLRVTFLATDSAKASGLKPIHLFSPGISHDIGKIGVSKETLEKTNDYFKSMSWGDNDTEQMNLHSLLSYFIIKPHDKYSANVILRHHLYQDNSYPKELPKEAIEYALSNIVVEPASKILSVADCYDALNRKNLRNGAKKLTPEEIKDKLYEQRSFIPEFVDRFYASDALKK